MAKDAANRQQLLTNRCLHVPNLFNISLMEQLQLLFSKIKLRHLLLGPCQKLSLLGILAPRQLMNNVINRLMFALKLIPASIFPFPISLYLKYSLIIDLTEIVCRLFLLLFSRIHSLSDFWNWLLNCNLYLGPIGTLDIYGTTAVIFGFNVRLLLDFNSAWNMLGGEGYGRLLFTSGLGLLGGQEEPVWNNAWGIHLRH